MNSRLRSLLRVLPTLTAFAISVPILSHLWDYYTTAPWTRDGHVRADIVQISPDVSGLITKILVRDNEKVKRGQVLFEIDRDRFSVALEQATANANFHRALLAQARREAARNRSLADLVSGETSEQGRARVEQDEAALAQAEAAARLARLNLERTRVLSPVDGYVNDRLPRLGDYVTTGRAALSLVDLTSFHVEGYFEETKLHRIQVGSAVDIRIMGESGVLHGHVQSIVAGIEDRDRSAGSNLLPNVNPTFNWVRLAQRVPVRITLDSVPADVHLVVGRTATVSVREHHAERRQ